MYIKRKTEFQKKTNKLRVINIKEINLINPKKFRHKNLISPNKQPPKSKKK